MSFPCPHCSTETRTYGGGAHQLKRRTDGSAVFRRRRICPFCGYKFITEERYAGVPDHRLKSSSSTTLHHVIRKR